MKNLFKNKILKTKQNNQLNKEGSNQKNERTLSNIQDDRFTRIMTDPKFKEMPKKVQKVELTDPRFKHMMTDDRFNTQTEYDQYGKRTKKNKSELHKYYSLKDKEELEENEEEQENEEKMEMKNDEEENSSDTSEEFEEFLKENQDAELDEAKNEEQIPMGQETARLSVLNLDWESVSASDLMVLFNSFCVKGQSIKKVEIYPSEFGINAMAKEKTEGPSREIYRNETSKVKRLEDKENNEENEDSSVLSNEEDVISDIDDIVEKENNDDFKGFVPHKLREYELQKLKYYYAIVYTDSVQTAANIYNQCDGLELDKTQSFLDLRFVPDSLSSFPYPAKEVCTEVPLDYDPKFAFNRALQHTKVKLTWDSNNVKRNEAITRAFKKEQFNEDEVKDLLMSSDSEDEEDAKMFENVMNTVGTNEKEENFSLLKKKKKNNEVEFKEGEEVVVTFNNDLENLNEKIKEEKPEKGKWEKYLERRKEKGREKKLKEKYRNGKNSKYQKEEEDEEEIDNNEEQVDVKGASKDELALLVKDSRNKEFKFNRNDERFKDVFTNQKYAIDPTHKDYKNTINMVEEDKSKTKKNKIKN